MWDGDGRKAVRFPSRWTRCAIFSSALAGDESALAAFVDLTNDETAAVLGPSKAAASNSYIRALRRLEDVLSTVPRLDDPTRE
jgi:hypothetical protein